MVKIDYYLGYMDQPPSLMVELKTQTPTLKLCSTHCKSFYWQFIRTDEKKWYTSILDVVSNDV